MNAGARLVILGLILVLVLGLVGLIVLAALDKNTPQVLELVVTGALTGLIGVLARTGPDNPPKELE